MVRLTEESFDKLFVPFYDYDNAFAEVIKEWNKRVGEQE